MESDPVSRPPNGRSRRWRPLAGTVALVTAIVLAGLVVGSTHSTRPRPETVQKGGHRLPGTGTLLKTRSGPRAGRPSPAATGKVTVRGPAQQRHSAERAASRNRRVRVVPHHPRPARQGAPRPCRGDRCARDGVVVIPADIHSFGWWDGEVYDGDRTVREDATAPGQRGVALLAGHVDSAAAVVVRSSTSGTSRSATLSKFSDSAAHLSTWTVDALPRRH